MKYHGKEGEESSLYRALGNRLRVAVLRTTFHFLQLNTVERGWLWPRVPSDQRCFLL